MSAEFVLLAALFVAVPIAAKYVTSFQIRALMDALKRRERDIDMMYDRLDGVEQEREVIERAVLQVYEQRRWSATRRDLMAEELQRSRRRRPRPRPTVVEESFRPEMPPVWEPEPEVEMEGASATAAEATV
jgi:hypothetical protein